MFKGKHREITADLGPNSHNQFWPNLASYLDGQDAQGVKHPEKGAEFEAWLRTEGWNGPIADADLDYMQEHESLSNPGHSIIGAASIKLGPKGLRLIGVETPDPAPDVPSYADFKALCITHGVIHPTDASPAAVNALLKIFRRRAEHTLNDFKAWVDEYNDKNGLDEENPLRLRPLPDAYEAVGIAAAHDAFDHAIAEAGADPTDAKIDVAIGKLDAMLTVGLPEDGNAAPPDRRTINPQHLRFFAKQTRDYLAAAKAAPASSTARMQALSDAAKRSDTTATLTGDPSRPFAGMLDGNLLQDADWNAAR